MCVLETIIQNNYTGLFARVRIGHESFAFSITDVSGRIRPFVQHTPVVPFPHGTKCAFFVRILG
jgi:hypothetical protein